MIDRGLPGTHDSLLAHSGIEVQIYVYYREINRRQCTSDTAYNLWKQFEQFLRFMDGVMEAKEGGRNVPPLC